VDPHLSVQAVPVTVIIPCFRCEETIGRALDSVRRQTRAARKSWSPMSASDDGSADKLVELTGSIPGSGQFVWRQSRGPLARGTPHGWLAATQPYIAFLDADDAWHPQKLELQYEWMQSHPDAVLTGHAIVGSGELRNSDRPLLRAVVSVNPARLLVSNRFQTTSVMCGRPAAVRGQAIARRPAAGDRPRRGRASTSTSPSPALQPVYGKQGASARLWEMERDELDADARRRAGLLGATGYGAAACSRW
jgi:glycosyltransferase involved in cell wall biosynthesis